jgi:hypothetical protein
MAGISADAKLLGRFRLSGPIVIGPQGSPDLSVIPELAADADHVYSVFQDTEGDTTTITLAFPSGEIRASVAGTTDNV